VAAATDISTNRHHIAILPKDTSTDVGTPVCRALLQAAPGAPAPGLYRDRRVSGLPVAKSIAVRHRWYWRRRAQFQCGAYPNQTAQIHPWPIPADNTSEPSMNRILSMAAAIVVAVLNKVDISRNKYYYSRYYGHQHKHCYSSAAV
jgi:hypothetical protein